MQHYYCIGAMQNALYVFSSLIFRKLNEMCIIKIPHFINEETKMKKN